MNFSRAQLHLEIEEKSRDLEVFCGAREAIRMRVLEVSDSQSQLTPLPRWSGTDAVLGSLDLAIHAMERTIEELKALMDKAPPDRPNLRLVKGDEDEQ